jgi:hypothetical protein
MRTLLRTSLVFFTLTISSVYAATNTTNEALLSKTEIKNQALELCRIATEQRFGSGSIKKMSGRSAWSNDMQGAMVKIKIKPQAKRAKKYYCLVKADKSVNYITR